MAAARPSAAEFNFSDVPLTRRTYGHGPTCPGHDEEKMFQKNWQELIKPGKLKTEGGHDAGRTATITAEPLERGFGLTLGNSLRRVLLSSLQGAAVTAISIEGVLHEFSSIQGVREDVTDIVLNVKMIALRMHAEGPKRVSLRKQGDRKSVGREECRSRW